MDSESKSTIDAALYVLKHSQTMLKDNEKANFQRGYVKLSLENIQILVSIYVNEKYPSKTRIEEISTLINQPQKKIENWFKHKRREDMLKGKINAVKKKIFNKEETYYLMENFMECRNPSNEKYLEIADHLKCDVKHIKNWYSYKRKIILKIKRKKGSLLPPKLRDNLVRNPKKQIIQSPKNEIKQESIAVVPDNFQKQFEINQNLHFNYNFQMMMAQSAYYNNVQRLMLAFQHRPMGFHQNLYKII